MKDMALEHSIKGIYRFRKITKITYLPMAKLLLRVVSALNFPVYIVNSFSLILALLSSLSIFLFPNFLFAGALLLFFSFVSDIVGNAWAKHKGSDNLSQQWLEETNGVIRIFLIFLAGTLITFKLENNPLIFLLGSLAIFSYMMMSYGGVLIQFLMYKYSRKEEISNVLRKSLGKKRNWIIKSPIGFSFGYQWTITIILIALNLFSYLFLIFIIFGNLKWIQGYLMIWRSKIIQ